MQTVTINLYSFEELSKKAKEKVLTDFYDINVDHDWWDCTYDDISNLILHLFGVDCELKGFDLGRGGSTSFNGLNLDYHNLVHFSQAEKGNYPDFEKEISSLGIVEKLAAVHPRIKALFEGGEIEIQGTRSNDCTDSYSSIDTNDYPNIYKAIEPLCGALDDLMDEIVWYALNRLQNEHDYLTSEKAIKETILSNEYVFTENGEQYD